MSSSSFAEPLRDGIKQTDAIFGFDFDERARVRRFIIEMKRVAMRSPV